MKQGIHPQYREVIYKDISCDYAFLTRSTADPKETMKWTDGKEYPVVKVEISAGSHPFFTGQKRMLDTEGRVEKFRKRYSTATKKK